MIAARIVPRIRDLGDGFSVRRALPAFERRNVGPFVFLDQMGPVTLAPGRGLDVRPHPHIGLATVTYLFRGEILHRDSLGSVQPIRPGEVNWMTAGRGIVHSERTPFALRAAGTTISGLQVWVALPREAEETAPAFAHHAELPAFAESGTSVQLILGRMRGIASPVQTASPMLYADLSLTTGARFEIPAAHEELALYVVDGEAEIAGSVCAAGELIVLERGAAPIVTASTPTRAVLLGGAPLDAPRFVWWNFVSSRRERIVEAAADWQAGRFPSVPGESESIPLPGPVPAAGDG